MSSHYTPDEQQQFDHHKGRASLSIRALAYWRSNTGGQEAYIDRGREMPWIQWAFEQLQANVKGRTGSVQGTAYFELMHQHTNDSLAGFYLLGFASNAEKAEKIEDVVAKQQAGKKLNKLERKIYENYKYRIEKMKDKKLFDIIDRRIQERPRMDAEEFAKKWAYSPADATYLTSLDAMGHSIIPTLTDADVPMLLEDADLATKAAVPEITSTRREGGGYLVQRGVFINGKRQQLAE